MRSRCDERIPFASRLLFAIVDRNLPVSQRSPWAFQEALFALTKCWRVDGLHVVSTAMGRTDEVSCSP